jgi:hypothetical protein
MSTQLTERPPTTTFPIPGPAWGAPPGRGGVAALALVLSSGVAGAYATNQARQVADRLLAQA